MIIASVEISGMAYAITCAAATHVPNVIDALSELNTGVDVPRRGGVRDSSGLFENGAQKYQKSPPVIFQQL
jgi:hypothetical protein